MNIYRLTHCFLILGLACSVALAEDREYGSLENWGRMIDPDGDCSFTISAHHVGIIIPATPHDLSAELNRMNAPRVIKSIEGDFEIEVEVWGIQQLELPTVETRTAYCGNGLLMMQDENNYIRLERAALRRGDTTRFYINFEQRINGRILRFGSPNDFAMEFDDEIYLKLSVHGSTVTGFVRKPNEEWHELGEKQFTEVKPWSAGITAVNATNAPLTANFRDLQLTRAETTLKEHEIENEASSSNESKEADTAENEK